MSSIIEIQNDFLFYIVTVAEEDKSEKNYLVWDADSVARLALDAWENDREIKVREIYLEDLLNTGSLVSEQLIARHIAKRRRFLVEDRSKKSGKSLLKRILRR